MAKAMLVISIISLTAYVGQVQISSSLLLLFPQRKSKKIKGRLWFPKYIKINHKQNIGTIL